MAVRVGLSGGGDDHASDAPTAQSGHRKSAPRADRPGYVDLSDEPRRLGLTEQLALTLIGDGCPDMGIDVRVHRATSDASDASSATADDSAADLSCSSV